MTVDEKPDYMTNIKEHTKISCIQLPPRMGRCAAVQNISTLLVGTDMESLRNKNKEEGGDFKKRASLKGKLSNATRRHLQKHHRKTTKTKLSIGTLGKPGINLAHKEI